jgi:hypothetical protein
MMPLRNLGLANHGESGDDFGWVKTGTYLDLGNVANRRDLVGRAFQTPDRYQKNRDQGDDDGDDDKDFHERETTDEPDGGRGLHWIEGLTGRCGGIPGVFDTGCLRIAAMWRDPRGKNGNSDVSEFHWHGLKWVFPSPIGVITGMQCKNGRGSRGNPSLATIMKFWQVFRRWLHSRSSAFQRRWPHISAGKSRKDGWKE